MSSKSKKLLVASHLFFVECAWKFLAEDGLIDFDLKGIAKNQEDIERFVVLERPDFIIIDLDSDQIQLKKTLAFVDMTTQSKIVLTGSVKEKLFYEEFKHLNVVGFLTNSSTREEIKQCLDNADSKHQFFSKEITDSVYQQGQSDKSSSEELGVSERELEIIRLISEGYINKEIAEELFISTHTVNTHRKNIMQKLGINNTAGIVLFAVKEGLVSPNEFLFSSGGKDQ